ncbi:MAG: aromatic amino acid ammonia-lyase [Patescibacteria group bacterium]|nr:aromatic amino acid ammonia-lyase [Patescibacteria group bacterium]
MKGNKLTLTGGDLTIGDIQQFIAGPQGSVEISPEALDKVRQSRAFLEKHREDHIVYGVNTGFGPMASYLVNDDEAANLQVNLIRSHATGMGEPIDQDYVLAAMLVRLNTLVKGYSGVSVELVERLAAYINKRIIPVVLEHGAVGTSGDLVQLAHVALALIGEGEVFYQGKRQPMSKVAGELKLEAYELKAKEGLSLINGTSVMGGIAAVLVSRAAGLLDNEIKAGAWALELVNAFDDSIAEGLHALRPHAGQLCVSGRLRKLLADSKLLKDRKDLKKNGTQAEEVYKISETVQEVYSFRCLAQILGPVYDAVEKAKEMVAIEINSVTDNPIVDWEKESFLHGGNFHGDYIAYAVDQLKMTIVKLGLLAERRINFFLNDKVNATFPPFLNLQKPGLTLGLQGLQFVATSTAAQSQTLAYPQYVHSIPTNADNQDVVSMGTDAALLCSKVVDNSFIIQAIEVVTLAQCTDLLKTGGELSGPIAEFYRSIREMFPAITDDRALANDLAKVLSRLKVCSDN